MTDEKPFSPDAAAQEPERERDLAPIRKRLKLASRRSLKLMEEVAQVAVSARVLALVAASDSSRRGESGPGAGELVARVGSIAFQAEESAHRAASLIGECEQLSASPTSPVEQTHDQIAAAIASLNEFAGVVGELHEAMREQIERVRDGDRPTLPDAPEALKSRPPSSRSGS